MTIEIKKLMLGMVSTNTFIVGDTDSGDAGYAIVIDPADNAPQIVKMAEDAGWTIKLILATHAHFDHVLGCKELKEKTGAPFHIHEKGAEWLKTVPQQGLMFTGQPFPEAAEPDHLLTGESEIIEVGAIKLETLFTPGHSPGHVSFYLRDQKTVFSGDCLFAGSIGRTDLPGGDFNVLMKSIFDKLLPLDDDVRVLPGHMQETTIGQERKTNPFVLSYAREHK